MVLNLSMPGRVQATRPPYWPVKVLLVSVPSASSVLPCVKAMTGATCSDCFAHWIEGCSDKAMFLLSPSVNLSAATQLKLSEEFSWKMPLLVQLAPSEIPDVMTSAAGSRSLRLQDRDPFSDNATVPS